MRLSFLLLAAVLPYSPALAQDGLGRPKSARSVVGKAPGASASLRARRRSAMAGRLAPFEHLEPRYEVYRPKHLMARKPRCCWAAAAILSRSVSARTWRPG